MDQIKSLAERHPESVAQLFGVYGYDMEPTPQNLKLLLSVYGNSYLPISNYAETQKPKKKLFEIINGGIDVLGNVLRTVNPKKYNPVFTPQSEIAQNDDRILGINKTLFLTIAGLTVLIVLIILFKPKK
jgi:hypothetical protein